VLDLGGSFSIKLPSDRTEANAFLVIDIYDLDNLVHPAGHVGWWRFDIDQLPERLNGTLLRRQDGEFLPQIDGAVAVEHWCNPDRLDPPRMELIAVQRSSITNAILSIDRIPVVRSTEDLRDFRSRPERAFRQTRYASHGGNLLPGRTVHIVSKTMFQRDAVGNLCLDLFGLLEQQGIAVRLYADEFSLAMNDVIRRRHAIAPEVAPDDIVLYFFSIYDDRLEDISELQCHRRIVYFHGVTPPRLLQVFDPELGAQCAKAIRQLPLLARFDGFATNSSATADYLREVMAKEGAPVPDEIAVIPPRILGESALRLRGTGHQVRQPEPNFLYVGRIKGHKKIEDLLHFLVQYRMLDPHARCTIVVASDTPAYGDYLEWVQTNQLGLPADAVTWLGSISEERLARAYEEANVYVSMSEHEGFCLPVLEAMMHDNLVLAYDLPAIRELMGPSGVIFTEKSFPELARRVHDLLGSSDACREVLAAQRQRAAELIGTMDGKGFLELLACP